MIFHPRNLIVIYLGFHFFANNGVRNGFDAVVDHGFQRAKAKIHGRSRCGPVHCDTFLPEQTRVVRIHRNPQSMLEHYFERMLPQIRCVAKELVGYGANFEDSFSLPEFLHE